LAAWFRCYAFRTVEGLGEDARGCSFSNSSGTGEDISVMDAIVRYRVRKGSGDRVLSNDLVERLRSKFARYYV